MLIKKWLILLGIFGVVSCNNSKSSETTANINSETKSDSVLFTGVIDSVNISHDIALWPFKDSVINSTFLQDLIGDSVMIEVSLQPNVHDTTTIDTIKVVTWQKNKFEFINNHYMQSEGMQYAVICDEKINLLNQLHVGITDEELFNIFKVPFDKNKTYKHFEIVSETAAESYLTFVFENHKVIRIIYQPYLG